jgi:hypothetical protein
MLGHVYGVVLSVEPWQRAGLQLELLSAARGWGVETAEGVDAGTLDVSYLGVTLLGDIKLWTEGPLRPYVLAGAELRYAIRAMRVRPTREPQDLSADITRLDIGVIAGTGLAWELAPRHELIIEARVDIGLRTTDSSEGNDNELLNRSFMIVLGYRYCLLPGDARSDESDRGQILKLRQQ